MEINRLNTDNTRIGENIRAAQTKTSLTWRAIAEAIGIHHVNLSKVTAGKIGLSEEKIIALAKVLNVHPAKLIDGISARAREDRFPHIPSAKNRNTRDTAKKGLAVSSVESLIKHPGIMSSFFGGIPEPAREHFTLQLLALRDQAATARNAH